MTSRPAHILDNPIWASLSTRHHGFAQAAGEVLRYPAEIAPFLGVKEAGPIDSAVVTSLVGDEETVFFVGPCPLPPSGWHVEELGSLAQMVCDVPMAEITGPAIVPLDERYRPAVLGLAALGYPHYFRLRTMELGRYFGIPDAEIKARIPQLLEFAGLTGKESPS